METNNGLLSRMAKYIYNLTALCMKKLRDEKINLYNTITFLPIFFNGAMAY